MLKRLLSLVLAALIAVPAPALPAQVAPPSIERPAAHAARDAAPALPRLAQRLSDTIPPLYMLGGDDKIAPVALWDAATGAFPSTVLTHSRTSLATQTDSTGKLTYPPNNLLTYSSDLTNAAWTKSNATITSGVSDPVGGTAAFTYTATANGSVTQGVTGASLSGQRTFVNSVWLKRRTGSGLVRLYSPNASPNSVTLTGAWQQFYFVGLGNANNNAYFQIDVTTPGDAVDVYLPVTAAVTYETAPRAGDQVLTSAAAYYGPRIDYDPNTLAVKGLLIEEARTNIIPANVNSGTMTSAGWLAFNATATANFVAGIDGTNSADKLVENASAGMQARYYVVGAVKAANEVYTLSAFLKQGTQRYALLSITGAGTTDWVSAVFDLQAGTVTQSSAGVAGTLSGATITASANGFYRVTVSGSMAATSGYNYIGLSNTGTPTLGSFGLPFYSGNTANYVLFAGTQFELGAFATSYIPGNGASVTRAADVVQFTGAALTALQGSAGSAIVQTSSLAANSANPQTFIGTQNISFTGNSLWYWPASTKIATANASQNLSTTNSPAIGSPLRAGVAWSGAGRSVAANGVASATDANPFVSTAITSAYLGSANGGTLYWLNGWVQSFAIYNQRLSDATLQAKSVVGASYAANANANPFAPQFAANDNLPVHWRIAL